MAYDKLTTEQYISLNLRYLLWKRGVECHQWAEELVRWAGCDIRRAEQLLRNSDLTPEEQRRIAQATEHTEEELRFVPLLEDAHVDVLQENLRYLINSLSHGEKGQLAKSLGVDASTVSKWSKDKKKGGHRPPKRRLLDLVRHFGLPAETNLETNPLFLSTSPLSEIEQRQCLRKWIDQLDAPTLRDLFPALKRLLEER